MKALCLVLSVAVASLAAKPERGPYNPTMESASWRKGDLYPAALGLRPWKPADPKELSGQFVSLDGPESTIELQVAFRESSQQSQWQMDGTWKLPGEAGDARVISWQRMNLELDSKHSYAYGARGCFILYFVNYRDPDDAA